MIRVLYCGDTQIETVIASKGIDTFIQTYVRDSSYLIRDALAEEPERFTCAHIAGDKVREDFPWTAEELKAEFDVVLLSDIGYDNFALPLGNRPPFKVPLGPSRPKAIRDFVLEGGGLIMAGGWLSFSGMDAKGRYGDTPIEEALPVTCPRGIDDRMEVSEGIRFDLKLEGHEIVEGLPWDDPYLVVGYNRVFPKSGATVIASFGEDPAIVTWEYGKGRSVAYTTDPTMHWGGTSLEWGGYRELWRRLVAWAGTSHG
jgi:uncharacterized membrane protein